MADTSGKKVLVGVCTMRRKARSKPMINILSQMTEYYGDWLTISIFPEEIILSEPVENWPLCDCLIGFHAADFPLHKAIDYAKLRQPYVINDLDRQFDLLDRVQVYQTLNKAGIEHPDHAVLMRNKETGEESKYVEQVDHIEIDGVTFSKPFVEKPVSAEDHNICIYYPSSVGGGSQRLFRKINNRSSKYAPTSNIRTEGSFIYEEFIPADGTDVKVYAVGPYYAHAEARKSPALDGKVERDSDGKEVRYPVILTNKEKMIARKVVLAFGQTVCGFDLLRAGGKSYVCDVNGFSFVKTSTKYYEDTAKILGNMILRKLAYRLSIPWKQPYQPDSDPPLVTTTTGKMMELRCVLAVIRHGDRTPKQKMKMEVVDSRFFDLFKKYGGSLSKDSNKAELKMKRPAQLKEVLDLARVILTELHEKREQCVTELGVPANLRQIEKELRKVENSIKEFDQLRTVLEMYGHFSGINRKIQLKYHKHGRTRRSSDSESESPSQPSLLLILKWGGELTIAGVLQAEALGKLFRSLYPGIRSHKGDEDKRGLGFLRLHSTYRHDLKIYASDEGRVQMTAAAFARGMLALEGELPPILVQMVKSANTDGLLDDDYNARQFQNEIKKFLHLSLQMDHDLTAEDMERLNPLGRKSIRDALEFIKNPRTMCEEVYGYIEGLCNLITGYKYIKPEKNLYLYETWDLAERRWNKLLRDFRHVRKNGDVWFDISKIPDIYDNIKYDMEHNPDLSINHEGEFERLYMCAKNMADVLVPQEYGIRKDGKLSIAQGVCTPLMNKIRSDLQRCSEGTDDEILTRLDPRASQGITTPLRHVRTRLYFTSESHIHSLMNLIQYGGLVTDPNDRKWQRAMNFLSGVTEYNYMTQLVMMLYEESSEESGSGAQRRFHVELLFSPGLYPCFQTEKEKIYEGMLMHNQKSRGGEDGRSPNSTSPVGDKLDIQVGVKHRKESHKTTGSGGRLASVCEGDSEDETSTTVNLVSLGEVAESQPFTMLFERKFAAAHDRNIRSASEELANASPPASPVNRRKNSVGNKIEVPQDRGVLMKSHSDVRCNRAASATTNQSKETSPPSRKTSVPDAEGGSRRNRLPYRFKHHTVNLLRENKVDNRLISTAVIRGGGSSDAQKKHSQAPAVLSTAVIARSSSAPKLQTYAVDEEISVSEIRRFWPPLRSLETLHDNISLKQLDDFLKRITTVRTPVPSPPKTPRGENAISRENSDLNPEPDNSQQNMAAAQLSRTLTDTARRLTAFEEHPK